MKTFRDLCFVCLALGATLLMESSPAEAQSSSVSVSQELPSSRMLSRFGLERGWWSQATLNPKRDKVKFLVLDEENIYVQGSGGTVTAYEADSGKRLWAVQLGNRDEPTFPGVSNDKFFLTVNGLSLYCVERFKGDVLWEVTLPAMPSVGPAVDDQHIYIGTLDGSIYSFELRKIDELFRKRLLPRWSFEALRWRYRTSSEITTRPTSTTELVEFANATGSLFAVSALERKLQWQFEAQPFPRSRITAPIGVTDDSLIVASENYYVYCLDRKKGYERWSFVSGFPIRKAPIVIKQYQSINKQAKTDDDLYIMPDHGGIFNLALQTGRQKWERPGITDFLGATKSRLFTSDVTGNVVLLQRNNGRPLGTLPLRPFSVRLENDRSDRLFLATPSGLIVCLRDQGSEFARFHKYPERAPVVPEVEPDEPTPPVPMPDEPANQ